MNQTHPVVTISGSLRNWESILEAASRLSASGYIVLMPFKDPREEELPAEAKAMYDVIHREKIDMSGELFVVNKDGYIGKSTLGEIRYAIEKEKDITFMEAPSVSTIMDIIRPVDNSIVSKTLIANLETAVHQFILEIRVSWHREIDNSDFPESEKYVDCFQKELDTLVQVIRWYFAELGTETPVDDLLDNLVKSVYKKVIAAERYTEYYAKLPHNSPWTLNDLIHKTKSELLNDFKKEDSQQDQSNEEEGGSDDEVKS